MIEISQNAAPFVASRRALFVATASALAAAIVILLLAVLPAEYGVDPTGLGNRLGFARLYGAKGGQSNVALHRPEERTFSEDVAEIKLGPRQSLEYKFRLKQGAALLYSWSASANVEYEFHGDIENDKSGFFESYEKKAGDNANGSFTAPFEGLHGWYWRNPSTIPVTIKLTTAGYYQIKGIIDARAMPSGAAKPGPQ
jgi:hypothetical protein